ncbi:DsbC family protein [Sphingomonas yabuuchiae]
MSAIEWFSARLPDRPSRAWIMPASAIALCSILGAAGVALAQDYVRPAAKVESLLKARLPKTPLTKVDCEKLTGLCEVTAGANLFYVDHGARYLVIGRVHDMETRQDLTAARLLEINPDMLVGGAAVANATGSPSGRTEEEDNFAGPGASGSSKLSAAPGSISRLPIDSLPKEGAIIWGNPAGPTVTVFSDFRCSYCRALSNVLRSMQVRVVERPISVLGSRDLAERVYCAKNREEALHAAYSGEPVAGSAPKCDTSGLDANEAFARKHGLSGTPVIVRSDGAMLEGYRPKAFLETWLKAARS